MPAQFVPHPDPALLSAYHLGKLSGEQVSQIDEHLEHCDSCCEYLAGPPDDSLVHLLRSSLPTNDEDQTNRKSSKTIAMAADMSTAQSCSDQNQNKTEIDESPPLPELLTEHPRYQVMQLIGKGGMGNVYKAEHSLMKRPVAVKLINQKMIKNTNAVERFRREVQLAARLAHPNIVAAFDAEKIGDHHFLVMEYIEGANLEEVVKQQGPVAIAKACDYIRQAARGLQHAFECDTVHRDIKPSNLMVTPDGQIKILDFGLAKFVSEANEEVDAVSPSDSPESLLTRVSSMLGTPDYMAPEQQHRACASDIRADIYSLGCTLYFLLTGRPPFADKPILEKLRSHLTEEPTPLNNLHGRIPTELVLVVQRMMAKNPQERYQTPKEVVEALESVRTSVTGIDHDLGKSPTQTREPPLLKSKSIWRRFKAPLKRKLGQRSIVALGSLLALILTAAIFYIRTNTGTIAIETKDPHVKVIVKQNGKVVTILDQKTKQQATLHTGTYSLLLGGNTTGLKMNLPEGEPIYLKRGDRKVAVVKRIAKAPPKPKKIKPKVIAKIDLVRQLKGHQGVVRALRYLPKSEQFVSIGSHGQVLFWDPKKQKPVKRIFIPGWHHDAAISNEGKFLAVEKEDCIEIWDLHQAKRLRKIPHNFNWTERFRFSPDGTKLVAVGNPSVAILWEVATGKELGRFAFGEGVRGNRLSEAIFLSSGKTLALARTGQIRLFDIDSELVLRDLDIPEDRTINRMIRMPEGGGLAVFQNDGYTTLLSTSTGKVIQSFHDATLDPVLNGAFLADPEYLVTTTAKTVSIRNVQTGKIFAWSQTAEGSTRHIAVSEDGHYFITGGGLSWFEKEERSEGSGDYNLRLWRLPESLWKKNNACSITTPIQ